LWQNHGATYTSADRLHVHAHRVSALRRNSEGIELPLEGTNVVIDNLARGHGSHFCQTTDQLLSFDRAIKKRAIPGYKIVPIGRYLALLNAFDFEKCPMRGSKATHLAKHHNGSICYLRIEQSSPCQPVMHRQSLLPSVCL
jgi:hypothetical protein